MTNVSHKKGTIWFNHRNCKVYTVIILLIPDVLNK